MGTVLYRRPIERPDNKRITIRLTEKERKWLESEAMRNKVSISAIGRKIFLAVYEAQQRQKQRG